MLLPAHVSAFSRQGCLHPRFADRTPEALALTEQMIQAFQEAFQNHLPLGELDELLQPLLETAPDRKFALALRKLLEDRCHCTLDGKIDFSAERARVLDASAQLLLGDAPLPRADAWQAEFRSLLPGSPLLAAGNLYGDLPENQTILRFEAPAASALLDRHDTGVVQALLLDSRSLTLTVGATDAPQLRRLCQYLRFFQLLADIETLPPLVREPGEAPLQRLKMTVDGPAALLEHGRKYGLQLALFFPAVCTMPVWELKAVVRWKESESTLTLNQDSGLKCPYHNFAAAIPEEVRRLRENFPAGGPWRLLDDLPPLRIRGGQTVFPDFAFRRRGSPKTYSLELFHRWHSTGLLGRLDYLASLPETPLLLGVERSLLKRKEIAEALEGSEAFARAGFLYRDYPTHEKILKALDSIAEKKEPHAKK